jgi:redox-sensitive bicupin YhaK (pirin superfamily)
MNPSITTVTVRDADTIWHEQGGWFDARCHFSFDRYRDPEQMGVGALRVFNDDRIIAGAEWPLHPHQDIESLTYVVEDTSCMPTRSATTAVSSPVRRRS